MDHDEYRAAAIAALSGEGPQASADGGEEAPGGPEGESAPGQGEQADDVHAPGVTDAAETGPGEEAPPAEPAPASAPDQPEDDELDRWAVLAREEQRLRRERQRMRQEREERQRQEAAHRPHAEILDRLAAGKSDDPLSDLAALGVDYVEITRQLLADGRTPPRPERAKPVEGEPAEDPTVAELRAQIAEIRQERQREQLERLQETTTTHVQGLLDAGREDRYELLAQYPGAAAEVQDLMRIEWERAGRPMDGKGRARVPLTFAEAADRLEEYLVNEARRAAGARKLSALFAPGKSHGTSSPSRAPRTLSTADTQEIHRSGEPGYDQETCRARAMAVLEAREKR